MKITDDDRRKRKQSTVHCILIALSLYFLIAFGISALTDPPNVVKNVFLRLAFCFGVVLIWLVIMFFKVDYTQPCLSKVEITCIDPCVESCVESTSYSCCSWWCKFFTSLTVVILVSVFTALQIFYHHHVDEQYSQSDNMTTMIEMSDRMS